MVGPTIEPPVVSIVLISLLPLLVLVVVVITMFYWYRVQRHRKLSQEQWDSKKPKRKGKGEDYHNGINQSVSNSINQS